MTLRLNLTDRFGNMITDAARVDSLLNTTSLQLSLKQGSSPEEVSIPWQVSAVGAQGISVAFSCNQAGKLAVSLVLGDKQLQDPDTGRILPAMLSTDLLLCALYPAMPKSCTSWYWSGKETRIADTTRRCCVHFHRRNKEHEIGVELLVQHTPP